MCHKSSVETPRPNSRVGGVDNLLLLQAAVDAGDLRPAGFLREKGKYRDALKNAGHVEFTHSDNDNVVGNLYPLSEFFEGLGTYDSDIPGIKRINWNTELSSGNGFSEWLSKGHSDIFGSDTGEAIRSVLGWNKK